MSDKSNVGQFRGTISEVDDPLIQDSGKVSGHSVEIQQMGASIRFWVPFNAIEKPAVDQEVIVLYKLVPQSSGWPKVKTVNVIDANDKTKKVADAA